MTTITRLEVSGDAVADIPSLISTMGDACFDRALLNCMRSICGVEHLSVAQLNGDRPSFVGRGSPSPAVFDSILQLYMRDFWRSDPLFPSLRRASQDSTPSLVRSEIVAHDLSQRIYTPMGGCCERTVLCGHVAGSNIALSMVRPQSRGPLSEALITQLSKAALPLLSIISKHYRLSARRDAPHALASLPEIEECVRNSKARFPPREAQVCARVLHGISTAGIALELKISEETVTTYRKRAYERLSIGSQHELLRWYLAEWNAQRACVSAKQDC